jgi:hypothetical protein
MAKDTSVKLRDDRLEAVTELLGKLKLGLWCGDRGSFFSKLSFLNDKLWVSDRPIPGYTGRT